jgi:hypothetical protein
MTFLFALAACGGPKVSKQKSGAIIETSPAFKTTRVVYVPRVIAIPADGITSSTATREGEALTITQIASVDPVVAVLRARGQATIEDFVSAVPGSEVFPTKPADSTATDSSKSKNDSTKSPSDSTKQQGDTVKKHVAVPPPRLDEPRSSPPPKPPLAQAWTHTLRITPRPQIVQSSDLTPDDGEDNPESPRVAYGGRPIPRTPGWELAIGTHELMRILDVATYTPSHGEPPGEVIVDFLWRWKSTKTGAPFDTESGEYQSLPGEVQQAAITGGVVINTSLPHWSRATLAREGTGWKVTSVNWAYGDDKPHNW